MSAEWPAVTRKRKVARLGVCLHFRIAALGSEKPSGTGELQGETRCPWRSDAPRWGRGALLKKYRARIGKLRTARRQGLERVQRRMEGRGRSSSHQLFQIRAVPDVTLRNISAHIVVRRTRLLRSRGTSRWKRWRGIRRWRSKRSWRVARQTG
jgi:hypothetical protein